MRRVPSTRDRPSPTTTASPSVEAGPAFAHASEAELSRILDFYAVRWEYEPHVFPILWNTDGDVLESFAPDFYLPDLDLYVEMTTLRQKLVRKKNRKLRRLRELYPDVRIKLFYARDFRALMLKYGRFALAEELSGTPGQVTPERPYAGPPRRPAREPGRAGAAGRTARRRSRGRGRGARAPPPAPPLGRSAGPTCRPRRPTPGGTR